MVVLLDEPGLSLHGRAQADFLRFINERLAPKRPGHLHDPLTIHGRNGPARSRTQEVLAVTDDSLFPLQAALG
ncbi:hypothetical protein ABZX77_03205 [Streptomyces sp. NPDC004237]|uniref:hypothetical protein n=1 Tax=Streptomyces sp. NPDC004237 TaxID=3154455 RepID=UPI0033B4734F